jgi:hypothetical protein
MKQFITKHKGLISGVLSGFDRLVFRGNLRAMSHLAGMNLYLSRSEVLFKDFGDHVQGLSECIKKATALTAPATRLRIEYLDSPKTDREAIARQIAAEQRITEGPICILSTVERCRGHDIYRNAEKKWLELELRWRKCLFYYH